MESEKQKYRQMLGFFSEWITTRYFLYNRNFVVSFNHHYIKRWDGAEKFRKTLKNLLNLIRKSELFHEYYQDIIEKNDEFEAFDLFAQLNVIEFLRVENKNIIISEIKSKYYFDKTSYYVQPTKIQIKKLIELSKIGIDTSIILVIMMEKPKFLEIPFTKFRIPLNLEEKADDKIKLRIPLEYRRLSLFKEIEPEVYYPFNWSSLEELIGQIIKFKNPDFNKGIS